MMRRKFSILIAGAAVLAALSGCTLLPGLPGVPTATQPASTSVDGFYAQKLNWHKCGEGMECTTVSAPVNWASPADGSIDLAVVRHAATGGKPMGSLLVNPGGPGGSGFDFVQQGLSYAVSQNLIDNYDIVGWDPRGVGQSTPVTCFTNDKDRDQSLYGTFDSPYDTQGWIDELTKEQAKFAAACEKNTGELLGNVDSASTARDMDLIRALLGDDKLNYLGYSYGTYLGTMYAELFPEKVGRMVLDGAIDPLVGDFDALKTQMAGFDSALKSYMAFCLDSEGCPFTGDLDTALSQVRGVLDTVDAHGLVNDDGRKLDSATVGTAIAENLYSESYWPDMTQMFVDLQHGDPSSAFINADYYNSRNSDGSYSGNSVEVYEAVNCVDGDFASDPASTLDRIAEIDAAAPILGKYFAYDDFAVLDTLCNEWPAPPAKLPTKFDAPGSPAILVIGTTNDPATPYAQSVSLAAQLSKGVLITHEGEGHTVYNQGVSCVDDTVDNYFVKGTVPTEDPMC